MKRLTALSLLLVMLCSAFMVGPAASAVELEITDPKQLGEVLELREKNSETYRLEDGSYECVIFAEDKYFEDETGELVEISNTVVPEKHTIAGKEYGFTNEANSNRIYFSENEPSVLVSTGKQDLAFSSATDRAVTPVIGGLKDMGEIAEYSLSGDTCFAYMNAFEHTDLVYKVRNGMLKEYIVLNDAAAPREFTFTFDTEGYTVSCTEYGTVGFYDSEGELVFELGDLFAVDSADAYTDELTYTIGETVDGKTDITVTLSEDYAADPERAYPILVDPSVVIFGTYETQDSFVSSLYPTTNYYTKKYIRMGWDSNYNIRRTYIRFNLPTSVPSNGITTCYMSLKKHDCGYDPVLNAYRVTGSWTSNTITWNNKPGYSTLYASDIAEPRANDWYRFYVTDIVKKWYAGTYQNYGFMVKNSTESGTGNWSTFYSSDADSPNKPELRINYLPYDAVLMAYDDGQWDRGEYFNQTKQYIDPHDHSNVYLEEYTSCSASHLCSYLQTTNQFYIHTHGEPNGIYIGNNWLTSSQLIGLDLSNLQCALLLTCHTGYGGYYPIHVAMNTPSNIIERMIICGAETVIGFDCTTYVWDCNKFAKEFAHNTMIDGNNVYYAIHNIDTTGYDVDMVSHAVIGGNAGQTLNN